MSSLLLMVAICQSYYSPLSVVAVLVLFFVCVLPLGWLGVIIIVCFLFYVPPLGWLGVMIIVLFLVACHPLAG